MSRLSDIKILHLNFILRSFTGGSPTNFVIIFEAYSGFNLQPYNQPKIYEFKQLLHTLPLYFFPSIASFIGLPKNRCRSMTYTTSFGDTIE